MTDIKFSVIAGDAFRIKADTLVLKFAQSAYGLDRDIIREFNALDDSIEARLPKIDKYLFTESRNITNTKNILFVGTPTLREFEYNEIRNFGRIALLSLSKSDPNTKSITMTIHGTGYGLDEVEAFKSQLAGIVDSIISKKYPAKLREIIFVERSKGRAERLQAVLNNLFPTGSILISNTKGLNSTAEAIANSLHLAENSTDIEKSIFVAMPFSTDFDDVYHYGIYGAVKSIGCLCERADSEHFTGDILEWVKNRISSADLVIADLSTANPNVYLEVGFAWGQGKKTILVAKDVSELKFNTSGQKTLRYSSIKELEEKLKKEMPSLL